MELISGSLDTHVMIWDILQELQKMVLKDHKQPIVKVHLWKEFAMSASKDGVFKIWDL